MSGGLYTVVDAITAIGMAAERSAAQLLDASNAQDAAGSSDSARTDGAGGSRGTGGSNSDLGAQAGGDSTQAGRTDSGELRWGTAKVIPLGPGKLIADLKQIARRGGR